jgi:hypothetical protein
VKEHLEVCTQGIIQNPQLYKIDKNFTIKIVQGKGFEPGNIYR